MRMRADREGYLYWEAGLPEEEELPEEEPSAAPDGGGPAGDEPRPPRRSLPTQPPPR